MNDKAASPESVLVRGKKEKRRRRCPANGRHRFERCALMFPRDPREMLTCLSRGLNKGLKRKLKSKISEDIDLVPRIILRKEVIQPQVPLRLPCYDFTPVAEPTVVGCLLAVGAPPSGRPNSHGVTGGVYKARERIHRVMLLRDY